MPAQIDCLASLFRTAPTHAVRAVVTAKGSLPFPAVAPRTAAYRIKILFKSSVREKKSKARTLAVNFDFVLLGNGRASAEMILTSFGRKPHFPAFEQSLAAKIAGRMTTDPAATPAP